MQFDSILVSVTEVCTVGCKHCGFTGTSRDREPAADELAFWVSQACSYGIPEIIFTGGEPFQRFELLKAAVAAAAGHPSSPEIATFTSSFWGRTREKVRWYLLQLPGLTHLYLSTDIYHQERVPRDYVANVIDGAIEAGIKKITLCITVSEDAEESAIRRQFQMYEDRVRFHVEHVIPTPFLRIAPPQGVAPDPSRFKSYCYLETPLINPNGDVSACHIGKAGAYVNLSEQVYFLGNLKQNSFAEIMAAAETNDEYQFLRVFGPQGIARMIAETEELRELFGHRTFTSGCDFCYKILRTPEGRKHFRDFVGTNEQRKLIQAARFVRFGEWQPAEEAGAV
jgi:hypothetical protein